MKHLLDSSYAGLIITGVVASSALLLETHLDVSQDVHFLLEILWVGVIGSALLAFAIRPALKFNELQDSDTLPNEVIPEFYDEDREWLQTHPYTRWQDKS